LKTETKIALGPSLAHIRIPCIGQISEELSSKQTFVTTIWLESAEVSTARARFLGCERLLFSYYLFYVLLGTYFLEHFHCLVQKAVGLLRALTLMLQS